MPQAKLTDAYAAGAPSAVAKPDQTTSTKRATPAEVAVVPAASSELMQ